MVETLPPLPSELPVLPALNEPDLAELPDELRRDMIFEPVETLEQALAITMPAGMTDTTESVSNKTV